MINHSELFIWKKIYHSTSILFLPSVFQKKCNFILKPKGPEIGKQGRKISIWEDGLSIRLSSTIEVWDSKIFLFKGNKTNLAGCLKAFNGSNTNDIKVIYLKVVFSKRK